MSDDDTMLMRRFGAACEGFGERLRAVRPDQWRSPTPCTQWTVRDLASHMTRGNLNYVQLLRGGSGEEFLRLRDADAPGPDAPGPDAPGAEPVAAFERSAAEILAVCAEPGALDRIADYPLGQAPGRQLVSIRLTDSVVHTWDLARAAGLDENLDPALVDWVLARLDSTYRGITESPVAPDTTHRFFAAPTTAPQTVATSPQDRLLHLMGRSPATTPRKQPTYSFEPRDCPSAWKSGQ